MNLSRISFAFAFVLGVAACTGQAGPASLVVQDTMSPMHAWSKCKGTTYTIEDYSQETPIGFSVDDVLSIIGENYEDRRDKWVPRWPALHFGRYRRARPSTNERPRPPAEKSSLGRIQGEGADKRHPRITETVF